MPTWPTRLEARASTANERDHAKHTMERRFGSRASVLNLKFATSGEHQIRATGFLFQWPAYPRHPPLIATNFGGRTPGAASARVAVRCHSAGRPMRLRVRWNQTDRPCSDHSPDSSRQLPAQSGRPARRFDPRSFRFICGSNSHFGFGSHPRLQAMVSVAGDQHPGDRIRQLGRRRAHRRHQRLGCPVSGSHGERHTT
jgi:hypothetical protein